eukprot:TRINITY_DN3346_c3_g1_i1.p1 TRINITY_DN3346_c3_g1~~TRINITY_DN3346_c3_g1_i1.p1  ORF type:complete len:199 (+),score=-22.67 TRINITY_DN3346_c3_g1_i1:158-754(+)
MCKHLQFNQQIIRFFEQYHTLSRDTSIKIATIFHNQKSVLNYLYKASRFPCYQSKPQIYSAITSPTRITNLSTYILFVYDVKRQILNWYLPFRTLLFMTVQTHLCWYLAFIGNLYSFPRLWVLIHIHKCRFLTISQVKQFFQLYIQISNVTIISNIFNIKYKNIFHDYIFKLQSSENLQICLLDIHTVMTLFSHSMLG